MAIIYKSERIRGIEVLSCTDLFEFQPHIHNRYVVWLNTGGAENYTVCGCKDILEPGNISVFEPDTVHSNSPCKKTGRHLRSFYIDTDFFKNLAEQVSDDCFSGFHFTQKAMKDIQMWKQLSLLHELMLSDVSDLMLNIHVLEIFAGFLERHGNVQNRYRKTISCDPRVLKVIDFLHANLEESITLNELANIAGCTEYHLIRLFRTDKGLTPHAYLIQIRLEHARCMIKKGNSILNSAHHSGFSDQSHLTRQFKLRYGLTPRAYQVS